MIAYNHAELINEDIHHKIAHAHKRGLLSSEEKINIENAYPVHFYSPNPLICIGLFLLTLVIVGFSISLAFLALESSLGGGVGGILVFFSLLCYGALEFFVQQKKHFHSGVDAALIWASGGLLLAGLNLLADIGPQANCIIFLIVSVYLVLRFAENTMVLVACCALFSLLFISLSNYGETGRMLLPFTALAVGALLYFSANHYLIKPAFRNYSSNLRALSILALLIIYISVNYFVVHELSIEVFKLDASPTHHLPLGWFFWLATFIIPIIYIGFGIIKKDRVMLRLGLLIVAVSVCTVKYYYSIMPIESMMLLGGLFLLVTTYFLMQYLRIPRNAFTSQADEFETDDMNVEGLIISGTMGAVQPAGGTKFGGGSFGGGGASGEF